MKNWTISAKWLLLASVLFPPFIQGNEIDDSFLQNRIDKQFKSMQDHTTFALMPYRRNYIVYSTLLDGINEQPWVEDSPDVLINGEDEELQFQVSVMVPIWNHIFGSQLSLYVAYTNRSFWQVFADDNSQPFRETNHEPEAWAWYHYDMEIGALKLPMVWLGFNHQSNGKWEPLSRGWNRVFMQFFASLYMFDLSWKPWYVATDSDAFNSLDGSVIDDYTPYMGDGALALTASFRQINSTVTWNYSHKGVEYGGVTADLEFPLTEYISLYGRYFYGYGESLIDMDYKSNTASVGFCVNDWQ